MSSVQSPESFVTINTLEDEYDTKDLDVIEYKDVIIHIKDSIIKAKNGKSKISQEILDYEGYSGVMTRHFYNNLLNNPFHNDTRYLEIGTWNGSSSISAIYKNKIIDSMFVDNWSQFGGTTEKFLEAIQTFGNTKSQYQFIENDCWKIDLKKLKKYNVYLFDGDHSELDHYKSLEYFYPVLEDVFIFIVDDWNWPNVRDGTMRAIYHLKFKVLFRHEEFMSWEDTLDMPNHIGKNKWWNGIGIFLLKKC